MATNTDTEKIIDLNAHVELSGLSEDETEKLESLSNSLKKEVISRILNYLYGQVTSTSSTVDLEHALFFNLFLKAVGVRFIDLDSEDLVARTLALTSQKVVEELSDIISAISLTTDSLVVRDDGLYLAPAELKFYFKSDLVNEIRSFHKKNFVLSYQIDDETSPVNFNGASEIISTLHQIVANYKLEGYLVDLLIVRNEIKICFSDTRAQTYYRFDDHLRSDPMALLTIAKMILAIRTYLKIDEFQSNQNPTIPIENETQESNPDSAEPTEKVPNEEMRRIKKIFLGKTYREVRVSLSPFITLLVVALLQSLSGERADIIKALNDDLGFSVIAYLLILAIRNWPKSTE